MADICSKLRNKNQGDVLNCLGVCRSGRDEKAYVKGLWSVRMWNVRPSTKCRKCLIDKYTARSSRSKVLYRDSAGLSCLEKYEMGHQSFPMYCWRTAPTAMSEASVMMLVGVSGFGCEKRLALQGLPWMWRRLQWHFHSTVLSWYWPWRLTVPRWVAEEHQHSLGESGGKSWLTPETHKVYAG